MLNKELEKVAAQAIEFANQAGAQESTASASTNRSVSFEVRKGSLEEVKDSTSKRLSIDLYVDGKYSSHNTSDLRPDSLKRFIGDAVTLTRALEKDPYRVITDPSLYPTKKEVNLGTYDQEIAALDRDERLKLCMEMNEHSSGAKNLISNSSSQWDGIYEEVKMSSNGLHVGSKTSNMGFYCSLSIQGKGNSKPADGFGNMAPIRSKLIGTKEIAQRAVKRTLDFAEARKGPSMKATLVLDRVYANRLIYYMMSPLRGQSINQKRSFWLDKLNKKVLSEKLTIRDEPLKKGALSSRWYDGWGVAAKPMAMIENGILKNYYIDPYYGKKLGMAPTAGGPSNVVISPGKRDEQALIRDVKEGIFLSGWNGGNMDRTTGDFSFGIKGFVIRNGKLDYAVQEMNVSGNVIDLFNRLAEVGNDPWDYSFNGYYVPTMVFEGVSFSGA